MPPKKKPARSSGAKSPQSSPKPARSRLAPEVRREALLEVSNKLFGEVPFDQLSMDDVAREANISKGLLYHYFPTKRDLYVETVRTAAMELAMHTLPDTSLPQAERLLASLVAHLRYIRSHAATYKRVVESGVGADSEVRSVVEAVRDNVLQSVLQGLQIEDPDELLLVSVRGWTAFIEVSGLAWLGTQIPEERMARLWMGLLVATIRATGAVPKNHSKLREVEKLAVSSK